ncbi:MAG: TIGR04283 family arsenosugar biosynthesis glycosyltransferase [Nitrospirae bacterium]|nr:TIGR04283 family arsenosugar biosynthesis glycosyltransferase [Nitrospirota bacterium]
MKNKISLSVIVPAINEEENIRSCIESAKRLDPLEIIVVDGGSIDRTREIALNAGAVVINSPKGRGIQMNRGASISKGDILLFLHADSIFNCHSRANGNPKAIFTEMLDSCWSLPSTPIRGRNDKKNYIGGFFRLKFDDDSISTRFVEAFANLRAKLFLLPYGDQAIFIKKDIFEAIGGFREYPFLEDIDMAVRLRRLGRLKYLPYSVTASSRRIKKGFYFSPIVVSLRNVLLAILFLLGVSPFRLIKLYK